MCNPHRVPHVGVDMAPEPHAVAYLVRNIGGPDRRRRGLLE